MRSVRFLKSIPALLLFLSEVSGLSAQTPIYLDSTAVIEDRVDDLLARMSLDEKIGQMTQADRSVLNNHDHVRLYYLGSILSGGGSVPADNSPTGWADMIDGYQAKALETPLKIPLLYGVDAVHGHNNLRGAVIFPHNIGMGCTRNPELVKRASEITALEVAATGAHWNFAPCVAVPRDERWGRTYEGYSEDPELVQRLGAASIIGLQGDSLSPGKSILACAKHYLADGGTTNGVDQGNAELDETVLRAIHMPGYITAIDSGVGSVMVSFSSWNGEKMHGNRYLLTEVLKEELGFEGILVSDWQAIDQLPGDYATQVETSINAGIDMVMVPYEYATFIDTLRKVVQQGRIPEERINDAVRRILRIKFTMGLFERPMTNRSLTTLVGSAQHRAIARQSVRESLVLLKKKDGILPLSRDDERIIVAGSHADDLGYQCGGWTITWQGGSGDITTGITILEALRNTAGTTEIEYSETADFSDSTADYSIVIIGEKPYAEGEGDRLDLSLPKEDVALVKKMKSYGNPVIVMLITGRPLIIEQILHYSDVIIAAWLPGTEGEGVTDILFGDYEPTGVLSFTWPKRMSQIPMNTGDAVYAPLYEYGFGITTLHDSPHGSAPEYLSSIIPQTANKIEMTFNKAMDEGTFTGAEFGFTHNGMQITPAVSPALKSNDSTTIVLTLDAFFSQGDSITIEYRSGVIASSDGGTLEPFGPVYVFNEVKAPPHPVPGKIEAEDYHDMYGVATESTEDTGGGLNITGVDAGDWLEYSLDVEQAGYHMLSLRIASESLSGSISITSDGKFLASRDLPVTGGAQNWSTVNQLIGLQEGVQTMRMIVEKGGFKLNWLSFENLSEVKLLDNSKYSYVLYQNFPNPCNESTTIRFELARDGNTVIEIFNPLGQKIKTLIDEFLQTGSHEITFNAASFSSGMYFCKFTNGEHSRYSKILLLK